MKPRPRKPEETYGPALHKALEAWPLVEPQEVATRAGVTFERIDDRNGRCLVPFFGTLHSIAWPQGTVQIGPEGPDADIWVQILLLHYLLTADGRLLASEWIAFRNLPGGLGYDAAFQGRANFRLAGAFGTDDKAFVTAARSLGGERLSFGDASFLFRALPRVWLAVVLYLADEDFSASAQVLFDGAASHYLETEDLAVLGGMLASRLIKAAKAAETS
jgi:hypothetical protein